LRRTARSPRWPSGPHWVGWTLRWLKRPALPLLRPVWRMTKRWTFRLSAVRRTGQPQACSRGGRCHFGPRQPARLRGQAEPPMAGRFQLRFPLCSPPLLPHCCQRGIAASHWTVPGAAPLPSPGRPRRAPTAPTFPPPSAGRRRLLALRPSPAPASSGLPGCTCGPWRAQNRKPSTRLAR